MEHLSSSWLKASEISKNVWRIDDNGTVSQYLVAGEDKALLIDCGWGIGNLPDMIAGLTKLPLTVINTHGHPDHTCGNYRFDMVNINEGDVPMLKNNFNPAVRYNILKRFAGMAFPPGFSEDAWVHARLSHFTPFKGPLSFDLGDRTVDVIETPGHTPGSICLFDWNDRLLFSADNISSGNTLLMMDNSLPLSAYLNSVDRLVAMKDKVEMLLPSHGKSPVDPDILADMQAGVRKVLAGEIKGKPAKIPLGSGLVARFGSCGIMYREDKL
jgi:glyoxylase-like metal-dependent hydrolase (beta-lactamase superfamily II)